MNIGSFGSGLSKFRAARHAWEGRLNWARRHDNLKKWRDCDTDMEARSGKKIAMRMRKAHE
jgi:hypothetical protein